MNKNAFISEHGALSSEILLNVAEILTLRLPEGAERIIASKWVKKFLACDSATYKNALSLFISSLTKQVLVEPFDQPPSEPRNQWQGFEREYTSSDINEAVKARLYKDALAPQYKIEINEELNEYLAFQEIPFFGAHFFYAFSPNETIDKWQNFSKLKVPKKYVEEMKLPLDLDSPVKGGFGSHPKDRIKRSPKLVVSKARLPLKKKTASSEKAKADWHGPIEEVEEEPEPEPVKKNMIVLPTDGPVKAIPPALQRRMLEAERQKAEKLAMKAQAKNVRSSKITPAVAAQKKRQGLPRKSLDGSSKSSGTLKKTEDDVLREESAAEVASLKESQAEGDEEPAVPKTFQERYAALRAATLADLPGELEKASAALDEGLRKAQEEGVADSAFVDEIQAREIEIANQLKDMLEKYDNQVEVVKESAKVVEDDIEALTFSARKINVETKKNIVNPETIDKIQELLTEVKEIQPKIVAEARTRQSALMKLPDEQLVALSLRPEVAGNAEKLLTLMGNVVQQAEAARNNLNMIKPTNDPEQNFITNSIVANDQLIDNIGKIIESLIGKIETKDPQLAIASAQMAANLQRMIQMFAEIDLEFAKNIKPSQAIFDAVNIQADKAAKLGMIHEEAGDIFQDIEASNLEQTLHKTLQSMHHDPINPQLRRQLGLPNRVEDEVIDIDDVDFELDGGVIDDEEFMNQTKAQKKQAEQRQLQFTTLFNNIADQESLDNITEQFDEILNDSFNAVDEVLEQIAKSQENSALTEEEQEAIERVKSQAEEVKASLEKSIDEVEDALREAAERRAGIAALTDQDYEDLFGPMVR